MQRYSKYKESGFEWIGEIPSHWNVGKLGPCFEERNEKVSDKDYAALSVTKNGIVSQMAHVAKTDAGDNRKKVCVNDFVINSRSDRKGSSGTSNYNGSVSLISTVLKPREYNPAFVHHLFRSYNFQEEFYKYGKGIVADLWSTRYAEMKSISVPLIPMEEQLAIANYLDRKTTRIDKLISEKQNFIKLLKEKRQALISHVFNVNSKHKLTKLGYYIDLLPGYAFKSEEFSSEASDIRLLRGANVGVNALKWNDVVYWPADRFTEVSDYDVKEGDIVFGMDRPWINNGARVAVIKETDTPCLLVQRVARIRAKKGLLQEYLFYAVSSNTFKEYAEADLTGVSVPHISPDQIKDFPFSLHSEFEQKNIIDSLNVETQRIDELITEVTDSIDFLKEHRTALISAAVTGKIDVRDQAQESSP